MVVSDDELLVASVRDEEAFASFYRRHAQPLAGFFLRRTSDAELAAEALRGCRRARPRNETGPGPRAIAIAADIVPFPPRHDVCAAPPGATEPGVCLTASAPGDEEVVAARCFTVEEIEAADTWLKVAPRMVIGLAPDGADRVTFDMPAGKGTESLDISRNAFGGELRSAIHPQKADSRFAP